MLQQHLAAASVTGKDGNADMGVQLKFGVMQAERLIDGIKQFGDDRQNIPFAAALGQQDAEFTLLQHREGVGLAQDILQPVGLKVGDSVVAGDQVDILPGNHLPLKNIPLGTELHNVELRPGKGGQIARSAGSAVQLVAKDGAYAAVKMPSGEVRRINIECRATVGQVGNLDHENVSLGKAGRTRWTGKRPHVRGVAMNPVDHPLGGGEGKTSGGRHPVTPWGQPTRGYKTRSNKRTEKLIVTHRSKKR